MPKELKKAILQSFTQISNGSANNFMQDKQTGKRREHEEVDFLVPSQPERSIPPDGDNEKTNPPDYEAYLKDLKEASQAGYDGLFNKANSLKLPPLTIEENGNFPLSDIDETSGKLMPTNLGDEYVALRTIGDGNCLFRAASKLAYGHESRHQEMRVRSLVELVCNKPHYVTAPKIKERIQAQEEYIRGKWGHKGISKVSGVFDKRALERVFEAEVSYTCEDSTWASYWHLHALATVFCRPVRSVFPEDSKELESHFNTVIHPRDGNSMRNPLVIMWTSTGNWKTTGPNHFVPLVPADKVDSSVKVPLQSQNIGEPGRRSSLPSNLHEENQKKPMQCSSSESYLSQMDSKDKYLKLADPLEKSVLNNLELLEGLAKYLDQGDPHGNPKCWRNLAEHFGVEASIYQTFTCSPRSPTEKLFAYLENRDGDKFTIEILKSGLHDIDRKDIITNILVKHQVLDSNLRDETAVERLGQTWPGVFDDIRRSLDVSKPGLNNWKQLAVKLKVPNEKCQDFEDADDPAWKLLEVLDASRLDLTVGLLREKLESLGMKKASEIISSSKKVKENDSLENFFDKDLDAVMDLCRVLNQSHNRLIRRWRLLGNKLGIKKADLDTFAPHEREIISPTHALINHLASSKPFLTMQDLIWGLDSIGRSDVVVNCFPVGRVQMYLDQRKQASDVLSYETPSSTRGENEV